MREIKSSLPCKAFKIIAGRMVEEYGASFKAHDEDNVVLGNGFEPLFHKLLDRNNYVNRPNKRKNEKQETPSKRIKLLANSRVGCPNWQPTETIPENRDKVTLLKNMSPTDPEFESFLKDTYPLQRQDIIGKEISEVYQEWPVLFTKKGIFTHFEMLTNINPCLLDIRQKAEKIVLFGKQKSLNFSINDDESLLSALKILGHHFKEDISKFIYQRKVS